MSVRIVLSVLILQTLAACAHYPSPPPTETPSGSLTTLPAFVFDPATARKEDGRTVRTVRSCAATYVAPHLLITSATAFPKIAPGERRADVPVVLRAADGSLLHVMGVAYLHSGDGIALVRTWEKGDAAPLSTMVTPRGPLTAAGFRYGPAPGALELPTVEPYQTTVAAEPEPYSSGGTFIRFRVTPLLEAGACGTPLMDRQGNFAGMIHERHGDWLSAISAPAVAEALSRIR